jgi:hypothetical protein
MKAAQEYISSLFDREFIPTGLKTALFVGSILFLINHGSALFRGEMSRERWISGSVTYLMPYLVNVYGQYASRRKLEQYLGRNVREKEFRRGQSSFK